MRIEFKLKDYDDILDEHEEPLLDSNVWTDDKEGITFSFHDFKVVSPSLHIAFRTGDCYMRNEAVEDPNDYDAYDYIREGTAIYAEDEDDENNYLWAADVGKEMAICYFCEKDGVTYQNVSELDCYIEMVEY